MKNKFLIVIGFVLIFKPVLSENYYIALDYFNKKQISKSINFFKKLQVIQIVLIKIRLYLI